MDAKFAYFLGWMYSDGCIKFDSRCNSAVVGIKILKSDEKTLRLFSEYADWSFCYEKDKYVNMRKNSNKLANLLIEHGVLPRKSYVNHMSVRRPKQITDEYMPYFIRGYFDGNGTYCWENKKNYMLSCGCYAKCYYLFRDFKQYLEKHDIKCELKEPRPAFYCLRIRTRPDVKRFIDLIFKDHLDLVLDRKYDKVKVYLENYHTTNELQSIAAKNRPSQLLRKEVHEKAIRTRSERFKLGLIKPSMTGRHHSEETKKKISKSNKAHIVHVKQGELLETLESDKTTT